MKRRDFPGLLAAAGLCASCELGADPTLAWRETLGRVTGEDEARIVVPDSGRVGVAFEVSTTTSGNGCWRGGPTRVTQEVMRAMIEPLDSVLISDIDCNSIGKVFPHRATVRFDGSGDATIAFRTFRYGSAIGQIDTVLIERVVIIR